MKTFASPKLLTPRLVRPVMMHVGLIGYPDMGAQEYDRGGEQRAVRHLVTRGYRYYQLVIGKHDSFVVLHAIAPHGLDASAYEAHVQAILDGNIKLRADSCFMRLLTSIDFSASWQYGPRAVADVWLDFTHAGESQNAVFLTFNEARVGELMLALDRLA